jgi:hypothetical protein
MTPYSIYLASLAKSSLRSSHYCTLVLHLSCAKLCSAAVLRAWATDVTDMVALWCADPGLTNHPAQPVSPCLSLLPDHGCCRYRSRCRVARNSSMPRVIVLLPRLEGLRCRYQQHIQRYHRLEQNAYDTQKYASARGGRRKSWESEDMRRGL